MSPAPQICCDLHTFTLRTGDDIGESLELVNHDDGGITIATALRQPDFCAAAQASLTHEQARELYVWLSQALKVSEPQ